MLSIDHLLSNGLFDAVSDVLRMDPNDKHSCYDACHVPLLTGIWALSAFLLFLIQGHIKGYLMQFCNRNRRSYHAVATRDVKAAVANQRTFSYPDTLEFNFFDPDNLPEMFNPLSKCTFDTFQMLGASFGFQVDSSRNQAEHLLMMLTNERRIDDKSVLPSVFRLHDKFFTNYEKWCDRIGAVPVFSSKDMEKTHQSAILDLVMWLLIWGEAANLRGKI